MLEAIVSDEVCALGAFTGARAAEDEDNGNGGGGVGWGVFGWSGEFGVICWRVDGRHCDSWSLGTS